MRLSFKLLGFVFFTTSILFAVLIFLHIESQKRDLTEAFIDRVKATSFIFTSSITRENDLNNYEYVQHSINHAMWGDPEILAIHVYRLEGQGLNLLVSSDPTYINPTFTNENLTSLTNGVTLDEIKNKDGREMLSIYQPLYVSGRIYGAVQIDSTLESVEEKINTSISELLIRYLLLVTIFLSLQYFFLRKNILKPLAVFNEAVTTVKNNNLDYEIRISSKDEFGRLSILFNEMLRSLKEAHAALLEYTKKIEAEVTARTLEIKNEKDRLEEIVSERTAELQNLKDNLEATVATRTEELAKTVATLEKMNKFMVDREVRIHEMKKKLAECGGATDGD